MTPLTTRLLPLAAALTLPAAGPPQERLVHSPAEGTTLVKTIVRESDVYLDDLEIRVDGIDLSSTAADMDVTVVNSVTVRVTDRYEEVRDGAVTRLARTFEELDTQTRLSLSASVLPELEDTVIPGSSALEGRTARFVRRGDGWRVELVEGGAKTAGDAAGLAQGLEPDLDFAAFLPRAPVAPGDTWTIEASALRPVFAPGGDLALRPEVKEGVRGAAGARPPLDRMLGTFTGRVEAELASVESRGGARLAEARLVLDVRSDQDLRDAVGGFLPDLPASVRLDVESLDARFAFAGTGRLVWNVDRGHLVRLELEGRVELAVDQTAALRAGGVRQTLEQTMTFAGRQTVRIEVGER